VARFFIALGLIFLAIGLLWPFLARLPLGHLPGDIAIRKGNFAFYFPLATSLLLSLLLTLILSLWNRR
jgi:hypothetical protein